MNLYAMNQTLSVEKEWIPHIISFLEKSVNTIKIIDVRNDLKYRKKDIDLLWIREKENKIVETKIEIKIDRNFKTGNYFFETKSNVEKHTEGCFLYSEADLFFYYFVNFEKKKGIELVVFDLNEVRKFVINNIEKFKTRQTTTAISETKQYHTEGVLVNKIFLKNNINNIKTFNMNKYSII